jgi:hypothetical protein
VSWRSGRGRSSGILLATALAAIAFHWLRLWIAPPAPPDLRVLLPQAAPGATSFTDLGGSPPRWTAMTPGPGATPVPVGSVVSSTDLAPDVRGYAGPVPVLVGVDPNGTITGVALGPNHETPVYAAKIEQGGFLRQFAGKRVTAPLVLDKDIDGVTRATVTAAAIAEGVRRSARAAASEIYGLSVPQPGRQPLPWPMIAAVALAVVIGLASSIVAAPALRWFSLAVSLAVLGFWQATWVSAVNLANALLWRWPAFGARPAWYLLFAVALASAALWRNVYCARLCPFGALQELLHALVPWRLSTPAAEDRRARRMRIAFLWLATVAVFVFGIAEAAHFEPFGTAFEFQGGRLQWALLGAVLLFAAVRHRAWCRYFCPTGTCLQLLGRMKTLNSFDIDRPAAEGGIPGEQTEAISGAANAP